MFSVQELEKIAPGEIVFVLVEELDRDLVFVDLVSAFCFYVAHFNGDLAALEGQLGRTETEKAVVFVGA